MYADTSYTVPALTTTYLVAYNANGGTGAPSTQIKTHGINLTLSGDRPTKTGYTFVNWLSSAQDKTYNPGALYGYDQNTTMMAQWTANTYTVSYNANGGENAPSNQTKTHGIDLTLTNSIPIRTNYNFLGWGTNSSSTTVEYSAGGTYSNNVSITLYAIWELAYSNPSISSVVVSRCDSNGVTNDYGEYVKASFAWSCDQNLGSNPILSISIKYRKTSETSDTPTAVTASGTSGTVSQIIGSGNISVDSSRTYLGKKTLKIDMSTSTSGMVAKEWIKLKRNTTYTTSMMMFATNGITFTSGSPLHMWLSTSQNADHLEIIEDYTKSIPALSPAKFCTTKPSLIFVHKSSKLSFSSSSPSSSSSSRS